MIAVSVVGVKRRSLAAVLAVVSLTGGCHGNATAKSPSGPVSSTGTPSQSADPDLADPCASPNTTVTRNKPFGGPQVPQARVRDLGPYVGQWNVHGEVMEIHRDGTGVVSSFTPEYSENDIVRLTRYRSPDRLLMQVVRVEFTTPDGAPRPRPTDACTLAAGLPVIGDSSILHFVGRDFLYESVTTSHLNPHDIKGNGGNPYWCGEKAGRAALEQCN